MAKTYTGYTASTLEKLLLDSGAFFVNYEVGTDTYDSAVAAGKLLGATRGGGSFTAIPELRTIEVDGLKGKAKGMQVIDSWEVKMSASVLEVTQDVLKKALISTNSEVEMTTLYNKITANTTIDLTDYIDNVTFVGKYSGSSDPIIIQIYNALNVNGLTLTTADKGESVIALEFDGHYDATDLDTPPFAIFYPPVG